MKHREATQAIQCEQGRGTAARCQREALFEVGGHPAMPGTGDFLCREHADERKAVDK